MTRLQGGDQVAAVRASGVVRCASVHLCSVCSGRIRGRRAREIQAGLIAAQALGLGAVTGLLSIHHIDGEALESVWGRLIEAWTYLWAGTPGAKLKARYGVEGYVWGDDLTHGLNGWHPHRHAVLFTSRPLTDEQAAALGAEIVARLSRWARKRGLQPPSAEGNRWEPVRFEEAAALASYTAGATLEKTSGRTRDELHAAASEVARMDTKGGKHGRNPFQILQDEHAACVASGGDVSAFRLWQEYEATITGGRYQATRWSNGLRERLGVKVTTDEEAAREVDEVPVGATVETVEVAGSDWDTYVDAVPGREAHLRIVLRDYGPGVAEELIETWRRLPPGGARA